MKILTSISTAELPATVDAVRGLAARGYDGVTTQENRHDPFVPLALAASTGLPLDLVTNVAIAFPRSPMTVANTAWDLQVLSGGRFHLGLGTQVRGHIVRRFSTEWTAPVARMRDYVRALDAIFTAWQTGSRLAYEGDHYRFDLMPPNFDPGPIAFAPPKVHLGAVGDAMLRLAATECDGVMLHPVCSPGYLREHTLPVIETARRSSARAGQPFQIVSGGFIATGPDDATVAARREWVRSRVGFYGSTPAYQPMFHHHDLGELGSQLHAMSKAGRWAEMTAVVSDDALDQFCVTARHDQLADAVAAQYGGIVDAISLDGDVPAEVVADLRRIPTRPTA